MTCQLAGKYVTFVYIRDAPIIDQAACACANFFTFMKRCRGFKRSLPAGEMSLEDELNAWAEGPKIYRGLRTAAEQKIAFEREQWLAAEQRTIAEQRIAEQRIAMMISAPRPSRTTITTRHKFFVPEMGRWTSVKARLYRDIFDNSRGLAKMRICNEDIECEYSLAKKPDLQSWVLLADGRKLYYKQVAGTLLVWLGKNLHLFMSKLMGVTKDTRDAIEQGFFTKLELLQLRLFCARMPNASIGGA